MTSTSDRQLTPQAMPLLADRLNDTIRKIEKWAGFSVSPGSRLFRAIDVLHSVPSGKAFPASPDQLKQIAHAVRDAQSFFVIGNMLGSERSDPVVTSLRRAIGGALGTTPHAAYRAQSELWASAMIAADGTAPVIVNLKKDEKSPDVIIKKNTMEYSVEVKRPQSLSHVGNMVSKAARQLTLRQEDGRLRKRFHGGALVVDLTDCLPADMTMTLGAGPPVLDALREAHTSLSKRIHERIYSESSRRILENRRHVFAAVSFVRLSWWDLSDRSQLNCITQRLKVTYLTEGGRKTLRYHRAHWLAGLICNGIREVGVEPLGSGELRFDS